MSRDCAGRHVCEHETYPASLDETTTCGECGRRFYAFRVADSRAGETLRSLGHDPGETLGWTTRADA